MELREAIIKYGQYRDTSYMDDTSIDIRCLIVPANKIEPILRGVNMCDKCGCECPCSCGCDCCK